VDVSASPDTEVQGLCDVTARHRLHRGPPPQIGLRTNPVMPSLWETSDRINRIEAQTMLRQGDAARQSTMDRRGRVAHVPRTRFDLVTARCRADPPAGHPRTLGGEILGDE
jgi:hypothetical protein